MEIEVLDRYGNPEILNERIQKHSDGEVLLQGVEQDLEGDGRGRYINNVFFSE